MEELGLKQLKQRMQQLARDFAGDYSARDLHSLAERSTMRLEFLDLGNKDGAYDPEHHIILINPHRDSKRQKFTLAHEIAHVLISKDDEFLSDLHDAYSGKALEQALEELCNYGAAHILIAPYVLQQMIDKHGFAATACLELARVLDISVQSAMLAMAEACPDPIIFALCAPAAPQKPMIVQFGCKSESCKYSLNSGIVIQNAHDICLSFETGLPLSQKSHVPFASGRKMPCWLSTYPEKSRVLCAFALH